MGMDGIREDMQEFEQILTKLMSDELGSEIDGIEFAERVLPALVKLEDMSSVAVERTADLIAKYGDLAGRRPFELRNIPDTVTRALRGDGDCIFALSVLAHNFISSAFALNAIANYAAIIGGDVTNGVKKLVWSGGGTVWRRSIHELHETVFRGFRLSVWSDILKHFERMISLPTITDRGRTLVGDLLELLIFSSHFSIITYETVTLPALIHVWKFLESEIGDVSEKIRTADYEPFLPLPMLLRYSLLVVDSLFFRLANVLAQIAGRSDSLFRPTGNFEEDLRRLWEMTSPEDRMVLESAFSIKDASDVLKFVEREPYEAFVKAQRAPLSWSYVCLKKLR